VDQTNELPPILKDQRKTDVEHLRLLSIFHYVNAGLTATGLLFLAGHYAIMHTVFTNPALTKSAKGDGPPLEFFKVFLWFYVLGAVFLTVIATLNVLSAYFIQKRINRVFSIIVAGLNCVLSMQCPIGIGLGVFTFVVLFRESVRELYDVAAR
jgi:hypothetical protein